MTRSLIAISIAVISTITLVRTTAAAPVVVDGTFANADWSATLVDNTTVGGATFSAGQSTVGGNPGDYRRVTHTYTGPGGFSVAHVFEAAAYDPSVSGAISSVDMSFDDRFFNYPGVGPSAPFAVAVLPLIRQGGAYYLGPYSVTTADTWVSRTFNGLVATAFGFLAGTGPANPDFSGAGGAIYFGFLTGNGSCCGGENITISGVDNFMASVELQAIPEPAAGILLLIGLTALTSWRRSRISPAR
jgi:hypothetical protein